MTELVNLMNRSHAGDKIARNTLVEQNTGMVWSIVRKFTNRGIEIDDLFQIGTIGLLKAIDRFDVNMDYMFSTYAVPLITGEIRRYIRDNSMIKVSRSLKENGWRIKKMASQLSNELGREASIKEIAAAVCMEPEEIVMALEANAEVESLYRTVTEGDGEEIYLLDKMVINPNQKTSFCGQEQLREDTEKNELLDHILIEEMMKQLNNREKQLIQLRYYEDKTQMQVAALMGMSQVQISRWEKKLLVKMRQLAQ